MPWNESLATARSSFRRGVHPAEEKELSREVPITVLETPKEVQIPLLQHLGAPCESVVKPRQEVEVGELLAESEALVSAPVHASVAGKVARETVTTLPNGRHVAAIPVKAGEQSLAGDDLYESLFGGDWSLEPAADKTPTDIIAAVQAAGIVGMGGAAFPTYVKLLRRAEKPVDTLVVNGCECEPYLTADYRVMVEAPEPIVAGARLAQRAAGADRVVIAI